MVDARSYVTTQQTLKIRPMQQADSDTSDLQRRAVEIAAESMAALFVPKRARLDEQLVISVKEAAPSSSTTSDDGVLRVQESVLKRLRQSEDGGADDAVVEEQQSGGVCPQRSSISDPDLESDGASSSAPEQRKTPSQSEQPARKVRVRKPTYAVRKVRLMSY